MDAAMSNGRTIQLFLVNGSPDGLIIAPLHGWTGSLTVCRQSTFDKLLRRAEVDRTGVYILYGPDPDNPLKMRAYVGEADSVKERIGNSASAHAFWETAVAITTSDYALTKGHVRCLEARLLEIVNEAARVTLANTQQPGAEKRHLPEADKSNMEAFLTNIRTVLPVVGIDMLKPAPKLPAFKPASAPLTAPVSEKYDLDLTIRFEIRHKSNVRALAVDQGGEFIVLEGSETLRNTGSAHHSYKELKTDLVAQGVLADSPTADRYVFRSSYAFRSPSAASAVVLDRSSNGRIEWKVENQNMTYHQWQEQKSLEPDAAS